mmetsp:Transcript_11871/g.16087  ORF Transcript_11871/g.16087 Transcript_11871/m.16087 type:complete len:513 (-) Transcript_11871:66-1604(-)|eukprot:CAMPEP_0196589866 /NCGR_PEP_ID=MMETSP1081-20130531/64862_1 /TAXON_ID=36882 /ORGANISM="Pyramimonas amylifera, Strain CCMP720" /LENGTH=512 /DNA_ID=CAMNT_0041912797 /DNA_START=41 /DNA_END=1579 /DNA_ORIENTATION=+
MKTSALTFVAFIIVVFGIAVLWKEESFVLEQPDVKQNQHHDFEATENQLGTLKKHEHDNENGNKSHMTQAIQEQIKRPPPDLQHQPASMLSDAEVDAMLPAWLQLGIPAQSISLSPTVSLSPQVSKALDKEAFQSSLTPGDSLSTPSVEDTRSSIDGGSGREEAEKDLVVRGPEAVVRNCPRCPPVQVPHQCARLQPTRGASTLHQPPDPSSSGRRLLAKVRTAFQSADRKDLATSRQTVFIPPSAALQEEVRAVMSHWRDGPACGFWTYQCVLSYRRNQTKEDKDLVAKARRGPQVVFPGRLWPEGGERHFPSLERGALGSCAVVAVSDRMLGKKRGPEIDSHDTVFRYNGPIKAYSRDIGSKGDVYYWKQRRDEKQYGVEGQRANKFYMWKAPEKYYMFAPKNEWSSMTFQGKQMLWETHMFTSTITSVYAKWMEETKAKTKHAASGGFGLALAVISSGLCERVDMYGFSAEGGGRYFKNAVVNTVHVIGLEHWVYRQAMEMGLGICLYD